MSLILSGSDGVSDIDGSASTPAIRGTDANTGIFFPAADTIGFAEGGAEVMRIDSSGRVGIGTTSPATLLNVSSATTNVARLRVTGTGSTSGNYRGYEFGSSGGFSGGIFQDEGTSALSFWSSSGGSSMVVDSSGNVGIGTTSPGTSNTAGASFVPGTSTVASMTGSNGSGQLLLGNNGNGSNLAANDNCGAIIFKGRFNGTFGGGNDVASILGTYTGNGTTRSGAIRFLTLDSGTEAERMRIDSSGNFLVGTTSFSSSAIGFGVNGTNSSSSKGACISVINASTNGNTTYEAYSLNAGVYRFYVGMGGTVFATNTTISAISDQRLKENIRDLDVGLAEIMQLQPRVFDWKEGKGKDIQNDRGFIAQEFEQVFPNLVDEWRDPAPEGEEPYKSVRQDLIPILVKAMQQQQAMIDELKAKVAALENK
jgi:hypothetical protein